jgi:hypothetical protein
MSTNTLPGFMDPTMVRVSSLGADDEVGVAHQLFDGLRRRIHRLQPAAKNRGQLAQPFHRPVDDGDIGAQADGHLGAVSTRDAPAQHHHLGGRDARHAAQQHA